MGWEAHSPVRQDHQREKVRGTCVLGSRTLLLIAEPQPRLSCDVRPGAVPAFPAGADPGRAHQGGDVDASCPPLRGLPGGRPTSDRVQAATRVGVLRAGRADLRDPGHGPAARQIREEVREVARRMNPNDRQEDCSYCCTVCPHRTIICDSHEDSHRNCNFMLQD